MNNKVSILIPVFNEEGNVDAIAAAIGNVFKTLPGYSYEILFVDDGSADNSFAKVKALASADDRIRYISFSRNFGKDNALLAGLENLRGDAVITIDADLQHPPELIPVLLEEWRNGYEVVYCFREGRNEHAGFLSQIFSTIFYKTINRLSDVKLENGISDYRLMDKKVVAAINGLHEDNPFFRGLVKWVGFKQKGIPYTPASRNTGNTSYNMRGLLKLAMHGITSFSTKPLNIAIYLGFIFSLLSILFIPYAIISKMYGVAISGWASVIVTIAFFGGLNLMILGIVGIYLGKTFMQGKHRPQFIIRESNIEAGRVTN